MKRVFLSLVLCLLTAACGSPPVQPSALQIYQELGPALTAATGGSTRLAADAGRLNHALSLERLGLVRARDIRLRRDALGLEREAGGAATNIRPLIAHAGNAYVREYLHTVLTTLAFQWAEADRLIHLADTVWWDPWLDSGRDNTTFTALASAARWDAGQAVGAVAAATGLRARHRTAFRYVPVRDHSSAAQAAGAPPRRRG